MQSISELVIREGKTLLIPVAPRTVLDALGLPGSAVPTRTRNGMCSVTGDVILEAEMVAFSDATGGIDGKSRPCLLHSSVNLLFRVLEDPESRREHRYRPEAQKPQDPRTDTGYVSSRLWRPSRSGD